MIVSRLVTDGMGVWYLFFEHQRAQIVDITKPDQENKDQNNLLRQTLCVISENECS
jgi:hypothetical protein